MKKKHTYFKAIEIFLIILVIALLCLCAVQFFNLNKKPFAYNFLPQCICLEVEYTDGSTAEGTAVMLNQTQAVSVAHLFEKEVESIKGRIYNSKEKFDLTLAKTSSAVDLAKLTTTNFTQEVLPIDFCDKLDINYGDEIVKFGNALGYGISAIDGIVANPYLKMEVEVDERELVQVSMQITSGDSGGAVFTKEGKFVGIISFKLNPTPNPSDVLSYIVPSYVVSSFID